MKKLFLIPLIILLAVGLVLGGCGGAAAPTEPTTPTTPTVPTTPTEPTKPAEPTVPTAPAEPAKPAEPTETIKLKFATFQPVEEINYRTVFVPWTEEIKELTNGRVEIVFYPGMSLGALPQHLELALSGTADIALIDTGATPGVFPLMEVGVLPMLYPSSEVAGMTVWSLMEKYMLNNPAVTELNDVKVLWYFPTGENQLATRTKLVTTLEDLEGMKIVTSQAMTAKALEKLKAVPVVQPPTEMYTSLERGLVDGVLMEWTGIGCTWQFYEITKYRTDDVNFGTAACLVVMNLDSWNSLPPDIQEIFDETTGAKLSRLDGKVFDDEDVRCRKLVVEYDKEVGNPEICLLPAAERARWVKAVQPVIDDWIAEKEAMGLPAQAMLDDLPSLVEKYSAE